RRDRRRRPARGRLRDAAALDRRAQAAARGVFLVPRSAQVRLGAALGIRTRRGADARLDLRAAPRARDDSLPAHDGAAHAMKLGALLGALARQGGAGFSVVLPGVVVSGRSAFGLGCATPV